MSSQSVLQVLQEGVHLEQNKHACKKTAHFKHLCTERGDISDGKLKEWFIFSFFFAVVYVFRIQGVTRNVADRLETERLVWSWVKLNIKQT